MGYALPHLYDALYSFKDYAGETEQLKLLIGQRRPGARSLLDVACGTGRHLELLQADFDAAGVDLDEGLLAVARERLPSVPLHVADMRTLELGRRFDVVTCLFSAIGHLHDLDDLDAAIAAMASHLEPGGLLIVEPWLEPHVWVPGRLHLLTVDEPDLKIARVTVPSLRDRTAIVDFHFLVATPAGVETLEERMELELFTTDEQLQAFERAGLEVEHDAEGLIGRGLFIGRKPATA